MVIRVTSRIAVRKSIMRMSFLLRDRLRKKVLNMIFGSSFPRLKIEETDRARRVSPETGRVDH
jgi:hypothetical protein